MGTNNPILLSQDGSATRWNPYNIIMLFLVNFNVQIKANAGTKSPVRIANGQSWYLYKPQFNNTDTFGKGWQNSQSGIGLSDTHNFSELIN